MVILKTLLGAVIVSRSRGGQSWSLNYHKHLDSFPGHWREKPGRENSVLNWKELSVCQSVCLSISASQVYLPCPEDFRLGTGKDGWRLDKERREALGDSPAGRSKELKSCPPGPRGALLTC